MKNHIVRITLAVSLLINAAFFTIFTYKKISSYSSSNSNVQTGNIIPECLYSLKHFDFHYKAEPDSVSVIMIGNSLIRWGDWNSLLHRNDILNRGISGDHLHCICERLKYLENTNAKLWIIEGGINDINSINKTNINQLYYYFVEIIQFAESKKAVPVVNLLLYINKKAGDTWIERKDYEKINTDIKNLNILLIEYCEKNNLKYIDLNAKLSDNDGLKAENTIDGVHLNEKAYKIWADEIRKILSYYNL